MTTPPCHQPIGGRYSVDYVLAVRSESTDDDEELLSYLHWLSGLVNVIVVDGSAPDIVARRARQADAAMVWVSPASRWRFANGKVNGVLTGVGLGSADKVLLADADVRYDADAVARITALLDSHDLVVPQNYFDPMPWHARWDTARSLLNRLTPAGDFPGTLALRQTDWLTGSGYDGNVLFENLELIRTVRAHGGTVLIARDLFVRRLPPTAAHFRGQRIRQAYDSLAQPLRLLGELALLPAIVALLRRPAALAAAVAVSVAAAEAGRRRANGRYVFSATTTLYAPAWLAERAVCSWLAVAARICCGGVPYSGSRLRRAAHSVHHLRRTVGTVAQDATHR